MKLVENLNRAAKKAQFKGKKYSPEILIVLGTVGVVASAVMACKSTLKLDEILGESKEKIDAIHDASEHPESLTETYSENDQKHDLMIAYTQTGLAVAKLYAPSVALGALSIGAMIGSHHILKKRNAALAAAYTAVDTAFKKYRANVVEKFGEQVDKEMRYSLKTVEIEDENGKKKKVEVCDEEPGKWAKFFDEASPYWEKDADYNLMFLRNKQAYANKMLKANGYLFLNDVYEMLGIDKTTYGQVIGWVYDENIPNGDNYVDFGLYSGNDRTKAFVNGYERNVLLDFNCDGNILELMS